MDIVMARTFNLMGKGLSPQLFIGKLYQQIELYKGGKLSHITLGNTSNKRDYISIDEAITHYRLIMDKGKRGEVYNVGTGKSIQISALLKSILKEEKVKLAAVKTMASLHKNKLDVSDIRADVKKLGQLSTSFKR
jgi:GDP-4-dehydro-6-deoxy-D-mannose reductase